jgi:hypothetical protein
MTLDKDLIQTLLLAALAVGSFCGAAAIAFMPAGLMS